MIWQAAGALGIDPRPFSLRELDLMLFGKGRFYWRPFAEAMALTVNMNCRNANATWKTFSMYLEDYEMTDNGGGIEIAPENIDLLEMAWVEKPVRPIPAH